jgi:Dockerin type I domain/Putative Ig domain
LVSDPDGDDWTLAASLDNRALPSWLKFNAVTREFTGIPTGIFSGPTIIRLRAFHPTTPELASVLTFQLNVNLSEKPMHNNVTPQDVNGDKNVTAGDALFIINFLNLTDSLGALPDDFRLAAFFDVTGDNNVSAADALDVLFQILQDDLARLSNNGSGEADIIGNSLIQPSFVDAKRKAHDEAIEAYNAESGLF